MTKGPLRHQAEEPPQCLPCHEGMPGERALQAGRMPSAVPRPLCPQPWRGGVPLSSPHVPAHIVLAPWSPDQTLFFSQEHMRA